MVARAVRGVLRKLPALTIPLFGLFLGAAFARLVAEDLARAANGVTSRSLMVATLFGVLVYAPATAYFLAFAPDWTYAYRLDSQRVPDALPIAVALAAAVSVPAGFGVAARWISVSKGVLTTRVTAATSILALASTLVSLPQLGVYATYAQYHGDFGTERVAGSPLGYALLWMALIVSGGVLWTTRLLKGISRNARRD